MPTIAELLGNEIRAEDKGGSSLEPSSRKSLKERKGKKKRREEKKAGNSHPRKWQNKNSKKVRCPHCSRVIEEERLKHHLRQAPCALDAHQVTIPGASRTPRIILYSKRGTRLIAKRRCANCGLDAGIVWRYSRTNRGEVLLCPRCKNKLFNHSHPKVDTWALVVDKPKPKSGG